MNKTPKVKAVGFTGNAWCVKPLKGNEAQAYYLEIEDGLVVKETTFPPNMAAVVLAQTAERQAEEVVTQ